MKTPVGYPVKNIQSSPQPKAATYEQLSAEAQKHSEPYWAEPSDGAGLSHSRNSPQSLHPDSKYTLPPQLEIQAKMPHLCYSQQNTRWPKKKHGLWMCVKVPYVSTCVHTPAGTWGGGGTTRRSREFGYTRQSHTQKLSKTTQGMYFLQQVGKSF